jgi:hypothetical protein
MNYNMIRPYAACGDADFLASKNIQVEIKTYF